MSLLEPFGAFAIRKGYATIEEVQAAVQAQARAEAEGKRRPLLGVQLLRMGVLANDQLIEILREMEAARSRRVGAPG